MVAQGVELIDASVLSDMIHQELDFVVQSVVNGAKAEMEGSGTDMQEFMPASSSSAGMEEVVISGNSMDTAAIESAKPVILAQKNKPKKLKRRHKTAVGQTPPKVISWSSKPSTVTQDEFQAVKKCLRSIIYQISKAADPEATDIDFTCSEEEYITYQGSAKELYELACLDMNWRSDWLQGRLSLLAKERDQLEMDLDLLQRNRRSEKTESAVPLQPMTLETCPYDTVPMPPCTEMEHPIVSLPTMPVLEPLKREEIDAIAVKTVGKAGKKKSRKRQHAYGNRANSNNGHKTSASSLMEYDGGNGNALLRSPSANSLASASSSGRKKYRRSHSQSLSGVSFPHATSNVSLSSLGQSSPSLQSTSLSTYDLNDVVMPSSLFRPCYEPVVAPEVIIPSFVILPGTVNPEFPGNWRPAAQWGNDEWAEQQSLTLSKGHLDGYSWEEGKQGEMPALLGTELENDNEAMESGEFLDEDTSDEVFERRHWQREKEEHDMFLEAFSLRAHEQAQKDKDKEKEKEKEKLISRHCAVTA